jgi:pyruvate/2-oxoglutarate dehydrogenase complex dihydrolipoamide dehydrogenase (E3) component
VSVVVLGGGVSGEAFVGALRRHDQNVPITLVEHELVGGECSYWACIPSKTLLRPLELVHRARLAPGAAEALDGRVDVAQVFAWRDDQAGKDDTSQAEWLAKRNVELVRGEADIVEPGRVSVSGHDLAYDHLLVATGSAASAPPVPGLDGLPYWTSREATSASDVPEQLVVVGGGAVGCELAQFYARIGSRVTLIQGDDYLLPRIDRAAGDLLAEFLRAEGIDVRLGARPTAVDGAAGRYRVEIGEQGEVEGTHLLIATGRKPRVEGFGLERLDVRVERTGIAVDDRLRAGDGVWAVGDVTGVALFTHVGKYQARIAAANVAGLERRADYRAVPAAIFTDPQVASVGDVSGEGVVTSEFRVDETSRAGTYQRPKKPGFVKLYADPERGVLVGALAVGPEAGEWLGQLTLAVRADVPIDVLRDTIQPFPTFSEAIFFAARDLPI